MDADSQVESQDECKTPNFSLPSSTIIHSPNCPTSSQPMDPQPIPVEVADKKKRKLTSDVCEHMKKTKKGDIKYAICNYCKKSLRSASRNGTTNLRNHLNICPAKNQGTIDVAIRRQQQKQIQLEKQGDGKVHYKNFTFDHDFSRHQLARAIILHEYPLSIVDHVGFRDFAYSLQPLFKMVSRNTVKKDIFKIYDTERTKLQDLLQRNSSRIAITTDMWTSNQKKGYMSITAHFVDDNWLLQSRLLRFIYMPAPNVIAENLLDGLTTWNVETKLSTITVDNCTTNDGVVKIIVEKLFTDFLLEGRLVHMRCCAHILNLIVKDGLTIIDSAFEKIRYNVVFWSSSPARWEKFEDMARQMKITCTKKLTLDCKTRWNSTYLMLQVALEYKDIFPRMKISDKHYSSVPSEQDWDLAGRICRKLKVFHCVTELFYGRKYPTSNTYFVKICELKQYLCKWMSFEEEIIASMATKMFEKYWSIVHVVMAISVILDPRYKMKVVNFYFPTIYGRSANEEIEKVKKSCYDLLQEYQSKSSNDNSRKNVCGSISSLNSEGVTIFDGDEDNMTELVQYLSATSCNEFVKSELDHYLEEPNDPWTQEFDILNWWKTNGLKYPTLQLIARDFLAIPISTVASESAFSTGGRVVSQHRSRLHSNTLEALICSQSWLWGDIQGHNVASEWLKIGTKEDDLE